MSSNPQAKTDGSQALDINARVDHIHHEGILIDMAWATNPSRPTPIVGGKNALDRAIQAGITAANVTVADYHDDFRKALIEMNKIDLLRQAESGKVSLGRGS